MTKRSDEGDWRRHVVEQVLPRMDANTGPAATGSTPATAGDFGPVAFHSDRTPDDAVALLDGLPAVKMTALRQRALDLHGSIPTHEQVQEGRLEALGHKNRIADLTRHKSEGGFGLDPASAPQVISERRKLGRAEKELARLVELAEIRSVRWTAAAQLHQAVSDWVLRGVPANCVIEQVEDTPVAELLKKGETLSDGVSRYQLRQRELDADAHRVNSQQWVISDAEADAAELIERRAEAGRPDLERAIEHGQPITFATMRLSGMVHNVDARGAAAFIEAEDAVGLVCWLLGPELLKKMSAGFREIGDDESALNERQRAEALATISADRLAAERSEVSLIWAAAERGEIIDFRSDTTPAAALGVSVRTLSPAEAPETSSGYSWPIRR
jgi:hypothetical protein